MRSGDQRVFEGKNAIKWRSAQVLSTLERPSPHHADRSRYGMAADYDTLRAFFRGRLIRDGECWVFTGSKSRGYGLVRVEPKWRGRRRVAHRVAYESFVAEVPQGLVLDHLCRNRACVNPSHLRVCSQRENILAPGSLCLPAVRAASIHCVNGHPFPAKTNSKGWRVCPVCRKEIRRRYLAKCSARSADGVSA